MMLHRLVKHFALDRYFNAAYGDSDDEQTRDSKTDVLAVALKETHEDPE